MRSAAVFARPARSGEARLLRGWADPLILGLIVFCGLVLLGPRMLADPDTQWHIAVGGEIWRSRALPWHDTYSHTFAGAPWIAKEWLSQLLLFGAYAAGGWGGTAALTSAVLAGTFAALFGCLRVRLRASLALAVVLLGILFLAPHFLVRPHVFGLATLLAWTIGLARALERGGAPPFPLLAVLVLWANLHGSFTLAYPLAALAAAEATFAQPAARRAGMAGRWALFGALAVGAGCLTPYGVHAMAVTATLFGSGEPLPFLTEWQPLAWDATGLAAVASAALLLGALAADPRRNLLRIVAVAGLTVMAVRHSRFLDAYGLVAPVLAAGPVVRRWPALGPEPAGAPGGPLRAAALAGLLAGALALALTRSPEPAPNVTPAAALSAARAAGVSGPVYNDYDLGGFLIREGVPTFIDGRTDQLFLGGFTSSLFRAARAEDGGPFLDILARHGVTWALVKPGSPEARHLERAGWRRLHADATAVVFARA